MGLGRRPRIEFRTEFPLYIGPPEVRRGCCCKRAGLTRALASPISPLLRTRTTRTRSRSRGPAAPTGWPARAPTRPSTGPRRSTCVEPLQRRTPTTRACDAPTRPLSLRSPTLPPPHRQTVVEAHRLLSGAQMD